jgi:hypothetical protein
VALRSEAPIQVLIAHPSATRAKPKKGRRPPARMVFLVVGIVVIVGGLIASIFWRPDPSRAFEGPGGMGPTESVVGVDPMPPITQAGPSVPAGAPKPLRQAAAWTRRDNATKLRPGNLLAALADSMTFFPVEQIGVPAKPTAVYVLLVAQLDDYTKSLWRKAGLLDGQPETHPLLCETPYLRRVTIKDAEALSYLTDWHVESVALSLPAAPDAQTGTE